MRPETVQRCGADRRLSGPQMISVKVGPHTRTHARTHCRKGAEDRGEDALSFSGWREKLM